VLPALLQVLAPLKSTLNPSTTNGSHNPTAGYSRHSLLTHNKGCLQQLFHLSPQPCFKLSCKWRPCLQRVDQRCC
jgi:hypothetical protein